jgi:hypothetical protein
MIWHFFVYSRNQNTLVCLGLDYGDRDEEEDECKQDASVYRIEAPRENPVSFHLVESHRGANNNIATIAFHPDWKQTTSVQRLILRSVLIG